MQIVIEIPGEVRKLIMDGVYCGISDKRLYEAIRNGVALPEGRGRLIDADRLQEEFKKHHDFYVNAYRAFKNLPRDDKSRVDEITASIASVANSPTIIEPYKAESESEE